MKTLIALRHAKSDHPPGVADFDRSLNERGVRDASLAGKVLLDRGLVPDVMVSSAARRARMTAAHVASACGFDREILVTGDLYEAGTWDMVTVIQRMPESAATAVIVGHNPGLWSLVNLLTAPVESFPTAAWAQICLPVDCWAELTEMTRGDLAGLWSPKSERL